MPKHCRVLVHGRTWGTRGVLICSIFTTQVVVKCEHLNILQLQTTGTPHTCKPDVTWPSWSFSTFRDPPHTLDPHTWPFSSLWCHTRRIRGLRLHVLGLETVFDFFVLWTWRAQSLVLLRGQEWGWFLIFFVRMWAHGSYEWGENEVFVQRNNFPHEISRAEPESKVRQTEKLLPLTTKPGGPEETAFLNMRSPRAELQSSRIYLSPAKWSPWNKRWKKSLQKR